MMNTLIEKWHAMSSNEKRALTVLILFILTIIIFALGIRIGQAFYFILN